MPAKMSSREQTPGHGLGLLPVELLQRIFELHTLINLGSPYVLRQVCRHWCGIVDDTALLRTRIYFGDRVHAPQEMVRCYSLGDLLRAIERTHNYQHELTIATSGVQIVDWKENAAKWEAFLTSGTSRCRSLSINTYWSTCQYTLEKCNLPELRELHIGDGCHLLAKTQFLRSIQQSSIHLCDLRVTSNEVLRDLQEYPRFLRRLVRLTINREPASIPQDMWHHLTNLVELKVLGESALQNYVKDTSPSIRRLTIHLSLRQSRPLLTTIYHQITHLIVTFNPFGTVIDLDTQTTPIRLPKLQYLELHHIWLLLCSIKPTNLDTLVLRGIWPTGGRLLRTEDRILSLPKALYIDVGRNIIDIHLARRLQGCWANIEELHLTYIIQDSSPSFSLRTVLEGNSLDAPVCPHLKVLNVLMPPPHLNAGMRRLATIRTLKGMARIRRSKGMLDSGYCGWLPATALDQKMIEDARRDWWKIQWVNLLD